jgi:DNA-binding SARP family transcriptional activator
MLAYIAQGRRSDALRQYQLCARILAEELGAQQMPETITMFQAILNNEHVPQDRTT